MSKITFILGGVRSGKSAYAVKLANERGKKIAFICHVVTNMTKHSVLGAGFMSCTQKASIFFGCTLHALEKY